MIIFPAIDIIGGKVVRLSEGDYDKVKKYEISPSEAAQEFYDSGARHLHVVDLDGAKNGRAVNAVTIEKIALACDMFIEVGGGIRSLEQIQKYLDCGVKRVILGTIAIKDEEFLFKAIDKYGDKISVGVDAKDNKVAINGWKVITKIDSLGFCRRLKKMGVNHVIYTDISKDGMLNGTNLDIYKVLCQTEYPKITASGGVSSLEEIAKLKQMKIYGAILGKALYENKIKLKDAISVAGNADVG